jgi:hypothetical protein
MHYLLFVEIEQDRGGGCGGKSPPPAAREGVHPGEITGGAKTCSDLIPNGDCGKKVAKCRSGFPAHRDCRGHDQARGMPGGCNMPVVIVESARGQRVEEHRPFRPK